MPCASGWVWLAAAPAGLQVPDLKAPCHVTWAHLSLCMSGNKEPGGLDQLCLRHCVQLLPLPQTMLDELLADNLSLLLLGKHTATFVIPISMF